MNKKFKTIGILGGMGPAASANMYNKIIKQAQKQFGAVQDTDYPPVILYSIALEGFDETGIADFALVEKQLVEAMKHLEKCGAELIVIACNTVHYFYQQMQAVCQAPILHIIKEAVKVAESLPYQKIGLVSSQSTSQKGLYHQELESTSKKQIITVPSGEQALLNEIVLMVMSGADQQKIDGQVVKVVVKLKELGAEMILLGCTELSMAFNQLNTDLPLLDAVDVLAELAVKKAKVD